MRLLLLLLLLPLGCELTPSFVEANDIDDAVVHRRLKTVCRGIEMKNDDVRRYATERMAEIEDPIAKECICAQIRREDGTLDQAVAEGLRGNARDEIVVCLAEVVRDPELPNRPEAAIALSMTAAPIAFSTLRDLAVAPGDADLRVRSIQAIAGRPEFTETLRGLMTGDTDPAIRAAAAEGLGGSKDEVTVAALVERATNDEAGSVRAAALVAVRKSQVPASDEMACSAMMNDPDPEVRRRAILTFRGTKRSSAVACLRKRALTYEEDPGVRDALLFVLKGSPSDNAAKVLCEAIPFWMRSYVKEEIPDKLPGTMIVKAQNDRDWERSYACLQNAYRRSSGYSCYARMHVALWFRELGGKVRNVPLCPGYEDRRLKED